MTRVLGVVAGLLWVVGIVVLIVGATRVTGPIQYVNAPPANPGGPIRLELVTIDHGPVMALYVGIGLVGVAGVLTAGLVLRHGRRP